MDAEGYPAQCTPGAGKGRVSAFVTKYRGAFVAAAGYEKLPAEPFLRALPGVSVIELLVIESILAVFSFCDSFLLLQIF